MPAAPLNVTNPLSKRIPRVQEILNNIVAVPDGWISERKPSNRKIHGDTLECLPCYNYGELVTAWKQAMRWTDGLDCALSAMLASVLSTPFVGEQLWIKIIGPPSCGKTTLLEGLAVNSEYVFSKDTIRGFHTGWKSEDGEDNSLVALARGKTLATKDGDTLLKQPNLPLILSEARGVYDRVSRTHYRNNVANDYLGLRMTWLLCGTSALREIDDSELGQRFIDCVVMDDIDDEFEDEVGLVAAEQESRNMLYEADGYAASQYSPELAEAMQLTGGYVGYLRRNGAELVSGIHVSSEALQRCARLGKFTAFMRARPSKKNPDETPDREFSPRLVKVMVRLAKSEAAVLNKKEVDEEVMRRVTKMAFDTARGKVLKITDHLYRALDGLGSEAIALYTSTSPEKMNNLLRFLNQIGVIELFTVEIQKTEKIKSTQRRWRLTERIRKLYSEIER